MGQLEGAVSTCRGLIFGWSAPSRIRLTQTQAAAAMQQQQQQQQQANGLSATGQQLTSRTVAGRRVRRPCVLLAGCDAGGKVGVLPVRLRVCWKEDEM